MIHIIQENLFQEQHYDRLIETVQKFGLPYHIVRVYPYVDWVLDINNIPDENDPRDINEHPFFEPSDKSKVFCWGSLSMSRICNNRNWTPGVIINDNYDYEVYSQWWGDMLLNYDTKIYTVGDFKFESDSKLFIRPTLDTKGITGAVYDEELWETKKKFGLDSNRNFTLNSKIQVGSPKNIQKEIRLWIVNGEVVTGSYYRLGGDHYLSRDVEPDAIDFAYKVLERGQLSDCFVLDICMSNGEWKIMEAGCMNHAGFYDSEIDKTIMKIEDYYG